MKRKTTIVALMIVLTGCISTPRDVELHFPPVPDPIAPGNIPLILLEDGRIEMDVEYFNRMMEYIDLVQAEEKIYKEFLK